MNLDEAVEKAQAVCRRLEEKKRWEAEQEAFYFERDKILASIPKEFRSFVAIYAWQEGHSAGFQEVLNYVRELVSYLEKPCQQYAARIRQETK